MADKVDKPKKKAKSKKDDKGVLAALPSTRPERIGTRRAAPAPKTTAATAASKAAAKPPAQKRAAKQAAAPKKAAAAATPRATATRRKAAAPRTFEPTAAAESAAGPADERAAGAVPLSQATPQPATARSGPRPRPVSEGAPGIGTADSRDQSPESARPSGAELAATAVKAAGEVAQLGLTIGGQVLKRVADRLPKP
jgi:hypothetical protein